MSSKPNFLEFQFSVSENRKKVDGLLTEGMNPIPGGHLEKDSSLESDSGFDLRKSLAWDTAFLTSPGVLDPEELFETLNFRVVDNGVDTDVSKEQRSLFSQSIEQERMAGIADCSMRRSLAWDSAFFTSEGVLDAEELSIVNRGFKKSDTHLLPGIEEGIWRSTESNSTIISDGYSLASLEIDLFSNIRASVNKSHDASSKRATSACKLKKENGVRNGNTSKTANASSRARPVSVRESKFSLKPPVVSGCANPLPTAPIKRASSGGNCVKMENKGAKATSGTERTVSKKTCLRESYSNISRSTTAKSPNTVLRTAANESAGFGCAPSFSNVKSSPNPLRRTIDSQMAASVLPSRTPSKYSAGRRSELVNLSVSTRLLSTPKSSSRTSPASSVDGWSSESSSVSLNKKPNSSAASHATTACRGISFDNDGSQATDSESHYNHQSCLGHEGQETKFMNGQINKITMGTSPVPLTVSRNLKPSGLRMPSPKIGFFDEENPTGFVPNEDLNFKHTSSKNGTSIVNGAASRTGCSKKRSAGVLTGTANKTATKEKGLACLRDKKHTMIGHEAVKVHYPENNMRRLDNKENIGSWENQVDDLSRHMEAIDFNRSLVTEFKANKGPCL